MGGSGGLVLGSVTLDQRPGTSGWQSLGIFTTTGTTLEVTVSQGGTGVLRADAMRATFIPEEENEAPTRTGTPYVELYEDLYPFGQQVSPTSVDLGQYFADDHDSDSQLTYTMGEIVKAGLLRPVDDYAKVYGWNDRYSSTLLDLNKFSSDGSEFGSGELYGLSQMGEIVGVFYNKDKVPTPPTTLTERSAGPWRPPSGTVSS